MLFFYFCFLDENKLLNIESIYVHRWNEVCHVVELGSTKIERICSQGPAGPNSEIILSRLQRLKALNIVLPESSCSVSFISFEMFF